MLGIDLSPFFDRLDEKLPEKIVALRTRRDEARSVKDWKASDALRTEIESHGYVVEDTPEGTVVTPRLGS